MVPASAPRMLGIAVADVSDWKEPQPTGKWSRLFSALAQRFELSEVVQSEITRRGQYLNLARTVHPSRKRWLARAGFNPSLVGRRTALAQRGLERYEGSYDLVFQLQTLCAPGVDPRRAPYVIYTDNTMALTQREYPDAARLTADEAAWWVDFETAVFSSAQAVFTCSEFARSSVVEDYGCQTTRVVAVGAGANQLLPRRDGPPSRVPRALFVGHDFKRKGGRVLLEAWPQVRKSVPNAELVIAGPPRKPQSNLPPGVSWLGSVKREALESLYESASVFVLPSLFEPWGFVFFEAMGHSLPCIGTDCCAMPEIIDHGVTGLLVPRAAAEPLAEALAQLLSDPDRVKAMGEAAHLKVLRENTWTHVGERIASHLATAQVSAETS